MLDSVETDSRRERLLSTALAALLLLLPFIVHYNFISNETLFYQTDHAQIQLPRFSLLSGALGGDHTFPLWQPLLQGGTPFHANPENPTFYLPAILLAFSFPALLGMNLFILSHMAFGAAGMYYFTKRLCARSGSPPLCAMAGAFLAGVFFVFNPYSRLEYFAFVNYGAAHAWIPWILLTLDDLVLGKRRARAAALLAVAVAMQVFTGGLYVYLFTALAGAIYFSILLFSKNVNDRFQIAAYALAAAAVALALSLAKLAPGFEWLATTERSEKFTFEMSRGSILWGEGETAGFGSVIGYLTKYTSRPLLLLLALAAIPRRRDAGVRATGGIAIIAFLIALGPLYILIYHIPPFDYIRMGSTRAWTAVDAAAPVLMGVGFAVLCEFASRRTLQKWTVFAAGILLTLALLPFVLRGSRLDELFHSPETRSQVISRYPQWGRVNDAINEGKLQSNGRAMNVDLPSPNLTNEQFITTAYRFETTAGLLGEAYPREMARHLWGDTTKTVTPYERLKRLGAMSVRYCITCEADYYQYESLRPNSAEPAPDTIPKGIDGCRVVINPLFRARAVSPGAVCAVFGDTNKNAIYALFDAVETRSECVSFIEFTKNTPYTKEELLACDAIIIIDRGDGEGAATRAEVDSVVGERVERVMLDPSPFTNPSSARRALDLVGSLSEAARARGMQHSFTRVNCNEVRVERADSGRGEFIIISEPWLLFNGWVIRGAKDVLTARRADGVATAVYLPKGERVIRAKYRPKIVFASLGFAVAGLAGIVMLLFWDRRRAGSAA